MDDEAELQAALEKSARTHAATQTVVTLSTQFSISRADYDSPQHHWKGCTSQTGVILQLDTINQFAQVLQPMIEEFDAPASTCGYFVMANALLLPGLLPKTVVSRDELAAALAPLWDASVVLPVVREAMTFVHARRSAWVDSHPADFAAPDARRRYLREWVANYEISDWLRGRGQAGVHFARYNQWPQHEVASHEERQRLVEEQHLGGRCTPEGVSVFGDDDAAFFVEVAHPERSFVRPEGYAPAMVPPPVLAADLNGHFVTCTALMLRAEEGSSGEGRNAPPVRTLVVINTTGTSYADHCAHLFDLCFPPRPLAAATRLTPKDAAELIPVPWATEAAEQRPLASPPSRILPDLFVGDHGASVAYETLVQLGITHILNVKGGARTPPAPYDTLLKLRFVPISDYGTDDLRTKLAECFEVIDAAYASGGGCLVHCSQGVNRSAAIAIAYLMCSPRTRWSLRDAWGHLRARRPCVSPHHAYWEQLGQLECAEHGVGATSLDAEEAGIFIPPHIADAARLRAAAHVHVD